jgi:hypothetical protein
VDNGVTFISSNESNTIIWYFLTIN